MYHYLYICDYTSTCYYADIYTIYIQVVSIYAWDTLLYAKDKIDGDDNAYPGSHVLMCLFTPCPE